MPELRKYRGRKVKHAEKILQHGRPVIKVILANDKKGQPGIVRYLTPEDYEAGLERVFVSRQELEA